MDVKLRNMTSVYLTGEKGILCLYRIGSQVVSNRYIGSAGGHFEPEELNDPKSCVLREMREELGIEEPELEGLRLRYITHRLTGGEIRQNYYFFARLKDLVLATVLKEIMFVIFADNTFGGNEIHPVVELFTYTCHHGNSHRRIILYRKALHQPHC